MISLARPFGRQLPMAKSMLCLKLGKFQRTAFANFGFPSKAHHIKVRIALACGWDQESASSRTCLSRIAGASSVCSGQTGSELLCHEPGAWTLGEGPCPFCGVKTGQDQLQRTDWWGWVVSHPRRQESVFNSAGTEHAKRSRRFRGDNRATLQDVRGATLYRLNIGLEHRSLYLGMCVPRVLPRWESNHWGSNSLF